MSKNYALVFVETHPPSVEIFRSDQFADVNPKERHCPPLVENSVRPVKRPSWKEILPGKLLRIGTKKNCLALKDRVTATGAVFELDEDCEGQTFVGSRFSELNKLKALQAASSRESNLLRIENGIVENGPGSVIPTVGSATVCRLPKKRPQEALDALQAQLNSLPCWKRRKGDTEVAPGIDVFANESRLLTIIKYHDDQPAEMFKKVLRLLLPLDVRQNEALSRTGSNDTVGIPEDFISAATGFVELHCKRGAQISLTNTIKGWLYYYQHRKTLKMKRLAKQGGHSAPSPPSHGTLKETPVATPSTSLPRTSLPRTSLPSTSSPSTSSSPPTSPPPETSYDDTPPSDSSFIFHQAKVVKVTDYLEPVNRVSTDGQQLSVLKNAQILDSLNTMFL